MSYIFQCYEVCLSEGDIFESDIVLIRMVTSRTNFGRSQTLNDITADKTLPGDGLVTTPKSIVLDMFGIAHEAVMMILLNLGDSLEVGGDVLEMLKTGSHSGGEIEIDAF